MRIIIGEGLPAPYAYEAISHTSNHELKAIALGLMQPETPYTIRNVYNDISALQGEPYVWRSSTGTLFNFFGAFKEIGAVDELHPNNPRNAKEFRLNNLGDSIIKPMLGHVLDLSLTEQPPLLAYFGPTNTLEGSRRPCEPRLELFRALYETDGKLTPLAKFEDRLKLPANKIGDIVNDLTLGRLVTPSHSGHGQPTLTFTATPNLTGITFRPDRVGKLLLDVTTLLQTHFAEHPGQALSNEAIAQALIDSGNSAEDLTSLIKKVSYRTHRLAYERDALAVHYVVEGKKARGAVRATEDQLRLIGKVLKIVDGFQRASDDFKDEGLAKLEDILEHPQKTSARHLIAKAKLSSIGLKRAEQEIAKAKASILELVDGSSSAMLVSEIQERLLAVGCILGMRTVSGYLTDMVERSNLTVTVTKEGRKYSRNKHS